MQVFFSSSSLPHILLFLSKTAKRSDYWYAYNLKTLRSIEFFHWGIYAWTWIFFVCLSKSDPSFYCWRCSDIPFIFMNVMRYIILSLYSFSGEWLLETVIFYVRTIARNKTFTTTTTRLWRDCCEVVFFTTIILLQRTGNSCNVVSCIRYLSRWCRGGWGIQLRLGKETKSSQIPAFYDLSFPRYFILKCNIHRSVASKNLPILRLSVIDIFHQSFIKNAWLQGFKNWSVQQNTWKS